eukprot:TRINITY_DN90446_c0_g1_i1.p1 TRINITY_DN90446_c0_g1~~TRINITY_DN90446_c0_g1_i1.p1  ORF type:complete len:459 (-),score=148.06 TRINITY_DN90446_c0_g1_i1:28-1404(-)
MASLGFIANVPNEKPCFVPLCGELLEPGCSSGEIVDLLSDAIRVVFGFEEEDADFRLLYREKSFGDEKSVAAFKMSLAAGMPCVVRVIFRLLGGKGGFGALLRKQMGQGKKTTNFDAMRDLSGRRLRHAKAVDRIKEWMEKKKRDDELVNLIVGEGPELPKVLDKHETLDPEYVQRLKRTAADRARVVSQGMAAHFDDEDEAEPTKKMRLTEPASSSSLQASSSAASSSTAGPVSAAVGAASSNAGEAGTDDWLNPLGMLSGSEEEDSQEAVESSAAAASTSASSVGGPASGSSLQKAKAGSVEVTDKQAAAEEVDEADKVDASEAQELDEEQAAALAKAAAVAAQAEKDKNAPLPSYLQAWDKNGKSNRPQATSTTGTSAASASVASTGKFVDVDQVAKFASAEQLAASVSADDIKLTLQHFGMKAGGKPEERAARLFLLKTTPVEKLPKSALAAKK